MTTKASHHAIKTFLRGRGFPRQVYDGGLMRLIEKWEKTARSVAMAQPQFFDDFVPQMIDRNTLYELIQEFGEEALGDAMARRAAADQAFQSGVVPTKAALIEEVDESERDARWWFFQRPRAILDGNEGSWPPALPAARRDEPGPE